MKTVKREVFRSSVTIPRQMQAAILRLGGKNPYGEPMYRVILAEDRTIKAAGEWNIWREGASLDDRGGLGIKPLMQMVRDNRPAAEINEFLNSRSQKKPQRVVIGMVDRPLYAFKGFVLEKWKPASSFGSPADWYAFRFQGQAALGEYPYHGDYELVAGPTPYMLTMVQAEDAMREDFRIIEKRPRNPRERLAQIVAQMEAASAAEARDQRNKARAAADDSPASLYNRVSLGAGRVRNQLAKDAGLKGHYGN